MKIHHLRSATFIIEKDNNFIMVDPMLNPKGSIVPIAFFRHKPVRNPIVGLPAGSKYVLDKVTHVLITHLHPDHLDKAGINFLRERNIPVVCSEHHKKNLEKKGVNVVQTLQFWKRQNFLNGSITGIPALHGYGFISKLMGSVMGFHIEFDDKTSIYISSDTIYTKDVDKVFQELRPDLSVLAAGSARFDLGGPLLMNHEDLIRFTRDAPGKVYANHMESFNHCSTTRYKIKELLKANQLIKKVIIPDDGELFEIEYK
jgi:L-ascorbate metabolism protein UlaG (beta-lactamase superfamily)